jgi:hypothetical protein
MGDPELQEAVESLLWSLDERTRCPVCYKIKSQGHTKNCRIGKLHAVLNSRVPRSPAESGGLAAQIEDAKKRIAAWPPDVRIALGLPLEPTRCIDCGVSLVPQARHFSGCKSHPGEPAVNGNGDGDV